MNNKTKQPKPSKEKSPLLYTVRISILLVLFFALAVVNTKPADPAYEDNPPVEADASMTTNQYHSDVTLLDDAGVRVTERLDVSFDPERHGIYRYIPCQGIMRYLQDGEEKQLLYTTNFEVIDSNVYYETEMDGNYQVIRFGNEDEVIKEQVYEFTYELRPVFESKDMQAAYMNVFPTRWQNKIPAGSTFTLHFPKGYEKDALEFYYGEYGDTKDASSVLELTYGENEVTGTLKEDLELGSGVTAFENMGADYFSNIETNTGIITDSFPLLAVIVVICFGLFLIWGFSPRPITSVQYSAPAGQDSSTVGYILDHTVDDKDIASLFLYWADQGILQMVEEEGKGLAVIKVADLPADAPRHQETLFNSLFRKKNKRYLNNLGEKFGAAANTAKEQIDNQFTTKTQGRIYTKASTAARWISSLLCLIPLASYLLIVLGTPEMRISALLLAFLILIFTFIELVRLHKIILRWNSTGRKERMTRFVGSLFVVCLGQILFIVLNVLQAQQYIAMNYATLGIGVLAATLVAMLLSAYTRRRTKQSREWMGWILGIREFIEMAELDRINAMAEEHPEWFYHYLPYAYVFGISDAWVHRLDKLGITPPSPEWYQSRDTQSSTFYPNMLTRNMAVATSSVKDSISKATAEAARQATASGGVSSSGGFGGGSSGGGGFSGGGFGGGGGGSW